MKGNFPQVRFLGPQKPKFCGKRLLYKAAYKSEFLPDKLMYTFAQTKLCTKFEENL